MKYGKIILFFNISLIFSIIMRFFQIKYTIEFDTGFFKTGMNSIGYFMLIAIFLSSLCVSLFSMVSHKKPEHPPKSNKVLGAVSFLPAIAIFYEVFIGSSPVFINNLQALLLKITGLLTIAFFIAYGLRQFIDFKIPELTFTIPCIYIVVKIICDFTNISSLALISDNIILIGVYCAVLLFMLNFAKLYTNTDENTNFRKLLSLGTASAVLCLSQGIAYIAVNLTSNESYNHVSPASNFSILSLGIFITTFIYAHFSNKNME